MGGMGNALVSKENITTSNICSNKEKSEITLVDDVS